CVTCAGARLPDSLTPWTWQLGSGCARPAAASRPETSRPPRPCLPWDARCTPGKRRYDLEGPCPTGTSRCSRNPTAQAVGSCQPLCDADGIPCVFPSAEAAVRALLALPRIPRQVVEELAGQHAALTEAPIPAPDVGGPLPTARSSTRSAMIRWV